MLTLLEEGRGQKYMIWRTMRKFAINEKWVKTLKHIYDWNVITQSDFAIDRVKFLIILILMSSGFIYQLSFI